MKEFIADKEQTLKEFTDNTYAQGSFYWNYLIKNKEIKVNGKKTGDCLLCAGDKVSYYLTEKQEGKAAFYPVYSDENIFIADKESGVNSEAVFASLSRGEGLADFSENPYVGFIHRLDRNTSGLIVFARNREAKEELLSAFAERRVEKKYHALCFGKFPKTQDVLTAYLKKEPQASVVKVFGPPVSGGTKIVTEYKVAEERGNFNLAEITLHTGKTHQIRAHMAYIGCPVVGDMKYGNAEKNRALGVTRQCLVAKTLMLTEVSGRLAYLKNKKFVSRFEAEIPSLK